MFRIQSDDGETCLTILEVKLGLRLIIDAVRILFSSIHLETCFVGKLEIQHTLSQ